jgi:excinuclease ABC subunit A
VFEAEYIEYLGIRTNNLKDLSIRIEKNAITCITGPSGSGKSSLAFDTIYQISQNELNQLLGYESFQTSYSLREYKGITPSVALEQNNYNNNPRSTIATYYGIDRLFNSIFSFYNNVSFDQFSFNKPSSACSNCRGLGYEFTPDITRIIDYDSKIESVPFENWRNSEQHYYYQILREYCCEINIDLCRSFRDLNDDDKNALLSGISRKKYKINFKQGRRKRVKTDYYRGPILELQKKIDSNTLAARDSAFVKKIACSKCNGFRFSKRVLKYSVFGKNLGEIYTSDLNTLVKWLNKHEMEWHKDSVCKNSIEKIRLFIREMLNLRLGYLNLNRSISSLSGGELQRLRISKILNSQFNDILYVLDEPSSSLHPSEYDSVIDSIKAVNKRKNTVIFIDHSQRFLALSKRTIVLGPGAGKRGGCLVDTGEYLAAIRTKVDYKFFEATSSVVISCESHNNIKDLSLELPLGTLIGICGISGSGKTSFVEGILPKYIENLVYTSQHPIRGNAYSIVATYTGILDSIRSLFARENKADEALFSFHPSSKGACPTCSGKGYVTYQARFESTFSYKCPDCEGKRYDSQVLRYTIENYSIADILNMSIDELGGVFRDAGGILSTISVMNSLGLGYVKVGQSVQSLSGGESQRLKLAKALRKSGNKFIVLDEPFKGLSSSDIYPIVDFLYEIVAKGCTVIIVEHNAFALSHCSYLIEFGPESGERGGKVIYNGIKSGIHYCKESVTREFLT